VPQGRGRPRRRRELAAVGRPAPPGDRRRRHRQTPQRHDHRARLPPDLPGDRQPGAGHVADRPSHGEGGFAEGQERTAMIRPTRPEDTPVLVELARGTGVFKPMEIDALREVLDDFHGGNRIHGHISTVFEQGGQVIGFAYYAPAAMTDRMWFLYWIA